MIELPVIWAAILTFAILAYVILDGFDLGIGILFPFLKAGPERDVAMNTVAPVWDGNETWLVLGGGGLFAAFPLAFSIIIPAVYAPITAMLLGLVFRGVAFEFRWRDKSHEKYWDLSFFAGSFIATFSQGIVLGAFVQGIKVDGRAYGGGWIDWLTPFSVFTGFALVISYTLLGATYLILKTEGSVRDKAYKLASPLLALMLIAMGIVSIATPFLDPEVYTRWYSVPNIFFLSSIPLMVLLLAILIWLNLRQRNDSNPFFLTLGLFIMSFFGLGVAVFPYIVPRAITVYQAASPDKSLFFMLVGAAILIPVILIYTGYSYWVFRGKVREGQGYH